MTLFLDEHIIPQIPTQPQMMLYIAVIGIFSISFAGEQDIIHFVHLYAVAVCSVVPSVRHMNNVALLVLLS